MLFLYLLAFFLGTLITLGAVLSAISAFILPRPAQDILSRLVFMLTRMAFQLRIKQLATYEARDAVAAFYAPVTLFLMPFVWLTGVCVGFMFIYWSVGEGTLYQCLVISGSSLVTLGVAPATTMVGQILMFIEAGLGMVLVALLISYLPTMYAAFSKREAAVAMLAVRAGDPPTIEWMIALHHQLGRLEALHDIWVTWEAWFSEIGETHTSLAALNFFRSPRPNRSWITAAGVVLDAAAFVASTLDQKRDVQAEICVRSGYLALRDIADFFYIAYDPDPKPTDPISITRAEYEAVCDALAAAGVPLKPDRDQTWLDFAGWRVNYDAALIGLCGVLMPPYAKWSSDRAPQFMRLPVFPPKAKTYY